MPKNRLTASQLSSSSFGSLQINVTSTIGYIPVADATISISVTGQTDTIEQVRTNSSGQTETLSLPAPPLEYSLEPEQLVRPYEEYTLQVEAEGYEPAVIEGSQILPDVTAMQPIELVPLEVGREEEIIQIPEHTLYGEYPPKIPEDEIKPMDESGEIVLSRVVIPEYIIVHDGLPNDSSAPNYYVKYKDYIKNVVSSEIYPTWPEETIYANTLAIQSFTLNRVYTEWYGTYTKTRVNPHSFPKPSKFPSLPILLFIHFSNKNNKTSHLKRKLLLTESGNSFPHFSIYQEI